MSCDISILKPHNTSEFDGFYAIYSTAFPECEQKHRTTLLAMLHSCEYTFFIAKDDEKIVGFCIMYHPTSDDFFLLEYMAIDSRQRGSGLGSTLLSKSIEILYKKEGIRPLFIEIDTPHTEEERTICQKREQFYRRIGALKVDSFTYILPSQTSLPSPNMEIMMLHPETTSLEKGLLRSWVTKIYTNVYGLREDDARIETMFLHSPDFFRLT